MNNFFIILFSYYLIVLIVYLLIYKKLFIWQRFCFFIISFSLPFVGILYFIPNLYKQKSSIREIENIAIQKPKFNFSDDFLQANIQYSSDILPLSDVLHIKGIADKRTILTNAIRQKTLTNQDLLFDALQDEDREISHYAVSIITNEIDNTEISREKIYNKIYDKQNNLKENIPLLNEYVEILIYYLKLNKNNDLIYKESSKELIKVLSKLIEIDSSPQYFITLINHFYENKDWQNMEKTCLSYQEKYPNDENAWLYLGKIAIILHQKSLLDKSIQGLKSLPISLSNTALKFIRYWS